jgi:hypothetical protein
MDANGNLYGTTSYGGAYNYYGLQVIEAYVQMGGNCPLQLHRRIGWILPRGRRHRQKWIAVWDHFPRG